MKTVPITANSAVGIKIHYISHIALFAKCNLILQLVEAHFNQQQAILNCVAYSSRGDDNATNNITTAQKNILKTGKD